MITSQAKNCDQLTGQEWQSLGLVSVSDHLASWELRSIGSARVRDQLVFQE